jgi:hypothetical protein
MSTYIAQNFMFFIRIGLILVLPYPQIFSCGCQYVFTGSLNIRNPHDLSWWEFMLKLIDLFKSIMSSLLVKTQVNDVHLVVH